MANCISCKSPQTKKITAIILQGTKKIDLGHGAIGGTVSRGGVAVGGVKGKTGGTIKSALIKKLEGRKPSDPFLMFLGITVFFFPLYYALTGAYSILHKPDGGYWPIISFVVLFLLNIQMYRSGRKTYPAQKHQFNNEWYCYQCGTIFVPPGFIPIKEKKLSSQKTISKKTKKIKK
tara:strand:- start:911 stop:1438 length:528 start_codon:yes stop_codon:yes gene_type:complete